MSDREDIARARDEAARTRDEAARDREDVADKRFTKRRTLDLLNWVMIALVLLWMAIITQQVILAATRISDINTRQITTVQEQNDTQLCAQHDITVAVISVARKLGLPTDDIAVPDIAGLACDAP
jgi:heme/copper-type cytochrome/quinol oxidase subunit 2